MKLITNTKLKTSVFMSVAMLLMMMMMMLPTPKTASGMNSP
jgi:hypothetical protein